MRVLEKRLRRLEVGLLPPPETAESRRIHKIALDIQRRRAAGLGLPGPEDVPEPALRPGMSLAETIIARARKQGLTGGGGHVRGRQRESGAMTSRNLARRLERLENRIMPPKEEPLAVVIMAVSADGQIGDRLRLTSTGLQRLNLPGTARPSNR